MRIITTFFIGLTSSLVSSLSAQPVFFYQGDGATGNAYEHIEAVAIPWQDALLAAADYRYCGYSHLATIHSSQENSFVLSLLAAGTMDAWLGAYQPDPSEPPLDGWEWITGEPWNYVNWAPGEPNDGGPDGEDKLTMWGDSGFGPPGTWNDGGSGPVHGYVVEWECEILLLDGFESGDTTAWSSTVE